MDEAADRGGATAAPPPEPTYADPRPGDFQLTVKILRKACFGSAGCNITFRIVLAYSGPGLDPDKTCEVKGGEDPLTNTLEVTGDQYRTDPEELITTKSPSTKLIATVTAVDAA